MVDVSIDSLLTVQSSTRVILQHANWLRVAFNRFCVNVEAWQLVSYSISLCFFVAWICKFLAVDKPLLWMIKSAVYSCMRTLPWVRKQIDASLKRARTEIEEDIHQADWLREFYKFIPERGLSGESIVNEARQYAQMGERLGLGTVHADPRTREKEMHAMLQVFDMFSFSDPHRSDAFPGARKMEAEIVKMVTAMLHGDHHACGVAVSGGTEAILLACLAYKNASQSRGVVRPNIVIPSTAHPAFDKAANLFGMSVTRVPVRDDDKVDMHAMRRAITGDTCMLAVSAPNHVSGTMDNVEKAAELAARFSIPLHVDASLGGFLLPFMEFADFKSPSFDFRLPGVSSISVDLHRYGQCPRRCSVLVYRDRTFFRHQCFTSPEWKGGVYATPTLLGGRDGGAVAAAWSTLLLKGRDGYIDATSRIVGSTRKLAEEAQKVDGIKLMGSHQLCMVTLRSDLVNIYAVSDKLVERGWHCDPLSTPASIRIPITLAMCEEGVIEEFLQDLKEVVDLLKENKTLQSESKTAAFHEMLHNISDRYLLEELVHLRLAAHYSMPPAPERRVGRSVSVDGRKMSMLGPTAQEAQAAAQVAFREVMKRKPRGTSQSNVTPSEVAQTINQ